MAGAGKWCVAGEFLQKNASLKREFSDLSTESVVSRTILLDCL